jgi:bifunctional non-homologous end joining protein LigD
MPKPADVRDTSIRTYRSKRDFTITAEPPPGAPKPGSTAPLFVVQKHVAKRAGLHWDLRLEHGGVLWSWAVRKGPSLDARKRVEPATHTSPAASRSLRQEKAHSS